MLKKIKFASIFSALVALSALVLQAGCGKKAIAATIKRLLKKSAFRIKARTRW